MGGCVRPAQRETAEAGTAGVQRAGATQVAVGEGQTADAVIAALLQLRTAVIQFPGAVDGGSRGDGGDGVGAHGHPAAVVDGAGGDVGIAEVEHRARGHIDLAAGLAAQAAAATGQAEGAAIDLHGACVVETVAGFGGAQAIAYKGTGVIDRATLVANDLGAGCSGCARVGEGGTGGDIDGTFAIGVNIRIAGEAVVHLDATVADAPTRVAIEVDHLTVAQGLDSSAVKTGGATDVERALGGCVRQAQHGTAEAGTAGVQCACAAKIAVGKKQGGQTAGA